MGISIQFHAPAALPPGKGARYPLDRRLGLDDVEKRKSCRNSNSDPSAVQPVAIPTLVIIVVPKNNFSLAPVEFIFIASIPDPSVLEPIQVLWLQVGCFFPMPINHLHNLTRVRQNNKNEIK
jgi:hypothetical protein